jgi:hypothetical protein
MTRGAGRNSDSSADSHARKDRKGWTTLVHTRRGSMPRIARRTGVRCSAIHLYKYWGTRHDSDFAPRRGFTYWIAGGS